MQASLRRYVHLRPSFRVAAHTGFANHHDKRAKIPQLDLLTASHRRNDFIQNGFYGFLNITWVEMWLRYRNTEH